MIQTYIDGAIAYAEAFCNRIFGYNSYTQTGFTYCEPLGVYPIESITEVAYVPFGGTAYTVVDPLDYSLSDWGGLVFRNGYLHPHKWHSEHATRITYTAGFTAETLPAAVRNGILKKVESLYDQRDDSVRRYQTAADLFLMTEKVFTI